MVAARPTSDKKSSLRVSIGRCQSVAELRSAPGFTTPPTPTNRAHAHAGSNTNCAHILSDGVLLLFGNVLVCSKRVSGMVHVWWQGASWLVVTGCMYTIWLKWLGQNGSNQCKDAARTLRLTGLA